MTHCSTTPSRRMLDCRSASRRGTAMSEMVMVLPLLVLVLVLLLFFGRGMTRVQRTEMLTRYETWRAVADAPGPAATAPLGNPQLNHVFFGSNADVLSIDTGGAFPVDVELAWINAAASYSGDAMDLTEAAADTLQRGRRSAVVVEHDVSGRVMQQFAGPVQRQHTRLNGDWLHSNGLTLSDGRWTPAGPRSTIMPAVRQTFFRDLDAQMQQLASADNSLAGAIQGVYAGTPGYVGPEVNFDPD